MVGKPLLFPQHQSDVIESVGQLSAIKEDVRFAACDLVCEWAQKVLKRQFDAVEDLARFLIDSHYISNKSLAALTITTGAATGTRFTAHPASKPAQQWHLVAGSCYCAAIPTFSFCPEGDCVYKKPFKKLFASYY